MMYRIIYGFFTLCLLGTSGVMAQESALDTVTVVDQKNDAFAVFDAFSGKPGKAGLYSLILPGAGQFYNRKYWKIPVFLAAEGITIGILIQNIDSYRAWDSGYKQLAAGDISSYRGLTSISAVRSYRDNARQDKDFAWIAVFAVHIVAAADAFVDRHLIEFDVEDDIGIEIRLASSFPGVSVCLEF